MFAKVPNTSLVELKKNHYIKIYYSWSANLIAQGWPNRVLLSTYYCGLPPNFQWRAKLIGALADSEYPALDGTSSQRTQCIVCNPDRVTLLTITKMKLFTADTVDYEPSIS